MSRDPARKGYYGRERDWDRGDYRHRDRPGGGSSRKRSRSPHRSDAEKRRSRTPRKNDKDLLDENILSEISKLPEPSELWEPPPFQEGGFPQPTTFQPENAPNPSYQPNYQPSFSSGLYDDFPTLGSMPQGHLPDMAQWNQMSLPPPPAPPAPVFTNVEEQIKKEAAIESEMRHQKAALSKQREDYIKKSGILKKELDTLKDQRNELRGDAKRSPSPDTKRFLKENTKLQLEIQNKLKTINNVVDMLNGIIGEEAEAAHESDDSAERKRKSRSPTNKKSNYVYYDPEMHWCRVCNEFPPTAKDYLNHLHSPAHHKMAAAHMEAPWHTVAGMNEGFPSYPSAPTKRTPIRGLQFFVPSTAWYCKLCDQFIGDLHCASAHLKSIVHSKNYTNFVEQNPHWETDWMSDRQKAFEKARATKKVEEKPQQYTAHTITFNKDGFHTKSKDNPLADDKKKKDKKKKSKRPKSSSSSSSSDSSSSDSDSPKKKKGNKTKSKQRAESKALTQWMSSIAVDRLNHDDRKLLDNLKTRIKKEKDDDTKRSRSKERAESRRRDEDRRGSRGRESRDRRASTRRSVSRTPRSPPKKPEVKKMPFIGKMPVYKSLTKTSKAEELKKEELKKREEDDMNKKRREEMDAEIQKKVAEFKEKIAKAQMERQQQAELAVPPAASFLPLPTPMGPPGLALPATLGTTMPPPVAPVQPAPPAAAPQPQQPPPPTLPKDFQEALDIIFPSEAKNAEIVQQAQEILNCMPAFPPGFPLGGVMQPFPGLGLQPPMFGFDLNPLFPPRPQLYDTHVPLVPSPKPRHKRPAQKQQYNKNQNQNHQNHNKPERKSQPETKSAQSKNEENGSVSNKQEQMDDLAMLGIDASDVGSGM